MEQLWLAANARHGEEPEDAPLLLLIAVEGGCLPAAGAVPCRVVGTLMTGAPAEPCGSEQPGRRIPRMLAAIGVPTNLLGYVYLCTALEQMLAHPGESRSLTRTLYPAVALRHGTTARCVERAIRHAIGQTWARGGAAEYARLLGRTGSTVGDRPTNSEFLAQVAEGVRLGLAG
ncbi:MAG: sporulation initiation factor Spo0A C-terminal domain-containing protein [Clostridia bacterium]|nr:sporulation initiation factor Spo0A C-terminal domain-containing protein [Clostridia bacterium]